MLDINTLRESQFHYGSIKTLRKKLELKKFQEWSQFHYGSIKTRYEIC